MNADRRVLFYGDSFVAGFGDATGRGWVGRVVEASYAAGLPLTAYNLGIRRDTSIDVQARWLAEAAPRRRDAAGYGVVFGVGVNDTTDEDGGLRVEAGRAVDALGRMLDGAAQRGLRAFVVGPPPSGEDVQDERIRALSAGFAQVAGRRGAPYVEVLDALRVDAAWAAEGAAGDGTHPGTGGYEKLAQLVLAGGWLEWLAALSSTDRG